jgi:hypothetical protein
MNEFENEFDHLVAGLENLVGEGEIEARKIMGNEQYEETVSFIRKNQALVIEKEEVQIQYIKTSTALQSVIAITILSIPVLATAWSFVLWFR